MSERPSQPQIVERAREAGIVGAGGAGFPTHVKLGAKDVDTVIANGAECEPLLRCDKAVMRERTELVLRGLTLLAEATSADRAVLALKGCYRDTVARVRDVARARFPAIEIHELSNFYPAGDEQVLVDEITGRVVPEGGIPLQVGAVVNNVLTLSQLARAVDSAAPVTQRALTVAGAVQRPLTCELPIGAPLRLAVELAGGAVVRPWAAIEGGPMMGRVVEDLDDPVTKCTSGVIVLPAEHPLVLQKRRSIDREAKLGRAVCCQCRMCTDLCPRHNLGHAIQPHLAMRALSASAFAEAPPEHITAAYLCCLCGLCEAYACTLGLSPRRIFGELRARLGAAKVQSPHRRSDCTAHDFQKLRRAPLPRLVARLGLSEYAHAEDLVDLRPIAVPAVRIPLRQHLGAPAVPVVQVGQRVVQGALLGEIPEGQLGARVHASISGTVTAVDPRAVCIERS